jgi:S1-C subfamily serine protease
LFRKHWDELRGAFHQAEGSPLAGVRGELDRSYRSAGNSIVEILDGEKRIGLATIVNRSGFMLTKASILPECFDCRLADGRVLAGTIARTVRKHDVAVVRIDAADLAPIEWSTAGEPTIGSALALAAADATPALGFISHEPFAFPAEPGHLRAKLRDTDDELQVEELRETPSDSIFMAIPASTLRPGDILLAMDGHSLSNLESYCKYLDVNAGDPAAVSGDAVRLVVRRGDEKVELREVLGPPTFPRLAGQTPRSTGFSRALSVDTNATTEMCGGPLIDRNGEAVGIVIAWRKSGWMLALPADIAKSIANNNAD